MKMPILAARAKTTETAAATANDPLRGGPLTISLGAGASALLKIDSIGRAAGCVVVSGWRIGEVEPALEAAGQELDCVLERVRRDDVAAHFPGRDAEGLGFVLIAEADDESPICLCWESASGRCRSALAPVGVDELDDAAIASMGEGRVLLLRRLEVGSAQWKALVRSLPAGEGSSAAAGHLESAVSIGAGEGAVVCGWAAGAADVRFWLENETGEARPLDAASRLERSDVLQSVGARFGIGALESGFVTYLEGFSASQSVVLKALADGKVHELHRIGCAALPADPLAVSRWLFGIPVGETALARHHALVEEPALSRLIERDRRSWETLPRRSHTLGRLAPDPEVSVIVPLYGRYDFVENQMVEWVRDPWFLANAELIYVIDDPALEAAFRTHALELFRLYAVPFKWVGGVVNRGFSGANNLGAQAARAERLLFLNSDVFPDAPGWLEPLLAALNGRPDLGAIGPRLVFAEGGIQHAGMVFERLDEYGVWINRHPYSGLSPALDPHVGLVEVPAVTGACMLVRRSDFDAVGGWDTGYLIGDFEDSDLCLKLRSIGLGTGYLPTVQLTHLERQSMVSLGVGEYRMRVVLWNAMRHQRRWGHVLDGDATGATQ
ncbi:hypothetical protein A7A76_09390 [Lysobacter enzymogenes]|uniref:glycosyltransferase family 2 protein n=1 Tax=Lysobacter enzymogenes TaxID=69 RepID=UPI0019D14225|nr:glycosyltransferase family 2 protein [Lysobacter enzymogenes]MBN7134961.1 hypothetical protein [Lysobacter enzymogenes]